MSIIVDSLQKIAKDMQESSAWDEIRGAALTRLEEEGIEKVAAELVLANLESETEQPALAGKSELSGILLKTASYIAELEAKIVTSESELSKVAEEQMIGDMSSFIDNGFSTDEARTLAALPEETLQKLAHNVQLAPETLGQGAGMDQDSMDPMMAFLTA